MKKPGLTIRIQQFDIDGDVVADSQRVYRDATQCDDAWNRAEIALREPDKKGRRVPHTAARGKREPDPSIGAPPA